MGGEGLERIDGVDGAGIAVLRAATDALVALDVSRWPDAAIADTFVELRREIDRLESVASRLLVAVEGRGIPYSTGATSIAAWSQWQTGQGAVEAKAAFDAGVACEALPLTAKAWEQGEVSASLARTICRGMRDEHGDVYGEIEDVLVHFAAERNVADLDGVIGHYRKCCDTVDDREPDERNGLHLAQVDGRWIGNVDLDALGGAYVKRAIDAATDMPTEDDTRTPARRRADAFVRIAKYFLDHADLPLEAGEAPHVTMTVAWESLRDFLPIPLVPTDPTDLAARLSGAQRNQLLCDSNIARIILGPDSQPLDVGRAQRVVPRWMRRAVALRDRHCRYPGCDRRPQHCEVHHIIAWQDGGATALWNLILLCPYHHHVIHRPGWTATFNGLDFVVHDEHGNRVGRSP